MKFILFLTLFIAVFSYERKWQKDMGKLQWHSFDEALELAKRRELPILGFFMGTECELCPNYLRMFDAFPRFRDLSKKFILAALDETDPYFNMSELEDEHYTPKFVFFDQNGEMLPYVGFEKPEYKYFYSNIEAILNTMEEVDYTLKCIEEILPVFRRYIRK